jgi:uncharacterized protein with FMN-binding domain
MLTAKQQRWVKITHVASAGVWLGCLSAMVWLEWQSPVDASNRVAFGIDRAIYLVHEVVLFWAFVVTLGTGLVFSLFTKWGFVTHDWVAAKWALALLLFGITLSLQSPSLSGAVALSDVGLNEFNGEGYSGYRATSLQLAILQLGIVGGVFVISFIKPWGRRKLTLPFERKWLLAGIGSLATLGVVLAVFARRDLERYRQMSIEDLFVAELSDGTYRGSAKCGFDYEVEVSIEQGKMVDARVLRNRDSHYARLAEAVMPRIQHRGTPKVDAISGATTTSKCLMRATQNALSSGMLKQQPAR